MPVLRERFLVEAGSSGMGSCVCDVEVSGTVCRIGCVIVRWAQVAEEWSEDRAFATVTGIVSMLLRNVSTVFKI